MQFQNIFPYQPQHAFGEWLKAVADGGSSLKVVNDFENHHVQYAIDITHEPIEPTAKDILSWGCS